MTWGRRKQRRLETGTPVVEVDTRGKHAATLKAIFTDPVSGSIKWQEIEAMLIALGAEVSEGSGSCVRFTMAGLTLFLHRPHPSPDTKRWASAISANF